MSIIDNIRRIAGASKPETKSANVLPSKLWKAMIWAGGWENYSRWPKDKLITQAYERNAPFYAACNIIAQTVADIPVYVDATKNGRIVQTTEHPILKTMELTESRTEFIERLTLYLCATGEAYAQVSYSKFKGKRPLGLVVVPSQFMNPVMGDYVRPVKGFRYTENGQVDFTLDEIIYIRKPSLSEYWHGMSAGVPTAELIDLFNAGITWNKNIALAGGVPPIIATSPSMLPEEQNEAKSKWREQRGANNAHELTIVSGDLKIDKINDNPHDAEWEKATLNAMRMILMSFGVSSELLNDAGNKTYCLPYKASVATPNGRKHIGNIQAGDIVYSLDLATDKMVESKVTWQGKTGHMKTKIAKGRGFRLEATDNHPVLVVYEDVEKDCFLHQYVKMEDLTTDHIVLYLDEVTNIITMRRIESITEGAIQDVYDIEVEGTHNFIAENIVVHNSNYREARKALYMEASIPMARKIYGAITKHLSKYYEDSPVICLDVDKIESIQEDRGFAAERLTRMVDAGIITPNEAREELGYSRKDGGDELRRYLSTPRQEQPRSGDTNEQPR